MSVQPARPGPAPSSASDAVVVAPTQAMDCRAGCGACCTAPSITTPIPGMPDGKPAGVRCIQLDDAARCRIFGQPDRPAVCGSLQPSAEMCGASRDEALRFLERLERETRP